MRLWFYVKDGQQHGPIAEDILVQMLKAGSLSLDTLVWTKELKDWTTARDVEGLVPADVFPPPVTSPPPLPRDSWTPPLAKNICQPSGPQVRPWVRYWARLMDFFLFALLLGVVLGIIYPPALEINDTLLGIIVLFVYAFVEPIILASWGTTPGKALLRVRLRQSNGIKLTFAKALNRSASVWVKGWGLGIPLVSIITLITAYNKLKKDGITTWDREGDFKVSHNEIGTIRAIITILFFISFVFLIVLGKLDT
jgi:hypothetical protein